MSTFTTDEVGLDTSKPQELYRFSGVLGSYTYTSGNRQLSFASPYAGQAETYTPIPLQRSEIVYGDITEKNDVKIDLPKNISLIDDYVFDISPTDDLTLEIYRRQENSASYQMIFYGIVAGFSVSDRKVTATCPSDFTNYLGTEFPNVYYQSNCNHALYDTRCGARREDFMVIATVVQIDADNEGLQFQISAGPKGNGEGSTEGASKTFSGVTYYPSDIAEWNRYLSDYPDVMPEGQRQVVLGNFSTVQDYAAWHYVKYGQPEGRVVHPTAAATASREKIYDGVYYDSSDTKEWQSYLDAYPAVASDGARAVAAGSFSSKIDYAAWHYQKYGRFQGFVATPTPGFQESASGALSIPDGWLVPGELVIGTERRLILQHTGAAIRLNYPLREIALGEQIVMYAGCRHNSEDCINKFNNGDNFLGFENIPYINPFEVGIG